MTAKPNKDQTGAAPTRLLSDLLAAMEDSGASDLLLVAGKRPQFRLDGQLFETDLNPIVASSDTEAYAREILPERLKPRLESDREADFAFETEPSRYRVSVYREKGSVALAIRRVPRRIPTLEQLELPAGLRDLLALRHGLVLVTGPAGTGKSTTLAALLSELNRTIRKHVLTIEDPIEFVYLPDLCTFSQREVGEDTPSFKDALRHALRHNPDVILIGEMRDPETTAAALSVAETGHFTLATVHTASAVGAITRIIDLFPAHQQPQIRTQLSFALQAIVAQTLVPRIGGGRIAACEILRVTPAVQTAIREDKLHQINAVVQTSRAEGMQTLDQHLLELVDAQKISLETCLTNTRDPDLIMQQISARAAEPIAGPQNPPSWPRRTNPQTS